MFDVLDDHNDITVLLFLAAQEGDAVSVADYAPLVDDIDARDDAGCTPLYYAAGSQCPGAVRELLSHGASPDSRNDRGSLPFDVAILEDDIETARVLVQGGADLSLMSSLEPKSLFETILSGFGNRAFRPLVIEWAEKNVSIFEKVPHAVHLAISRHGVDSDIAKLIDAGCPLSCLDEYKNSPLENAVFWALTESVGAMLRRGVDTSTADPDGFNIAWHLVYGPNDEQDKLIQIAKMLFDYCPSAFKVMEGEKRLSDGLRLVNKHELADFVARECES